MSREEISRTNSKQNALFPNSGASSKKGECRYGATKQALSGEMKLRGTDVGRLNEMHPIMHHVHSHYFLNDSLLYA